MQRLRPLSDAQPWERSACPQSWSVKKKRFCSEKKTFINNYLLVMRKFTDFSVNLFDSVEDQYIFFVSVIYIGLKIFGGTFLILLYFYLIPRAPDSRQRQRVLRHVHLRQLRLRPASAPVEPWETTRLVVQPCSSAQNPPNQMSFQ